MSLDQHSNSLTSGCTSCDQTILAIFTNKSVSSVHCKADSSGSEGVADGKGATPIVQFLNRNVPDFARTLHHILENVTKRASFV